MCIWDPVFDLGPGDKGDSTVPYCDERVEPGYGGEHDGIRRTLDLKNTNPDLKVLFAVGSWKARRNQVSIQSSHGSDLGFWTRDATDLSFL